jgi:hypothetical protein
MPRVSTEADREVLDAAWGLIPQSRESAPDLGSFTRTRIERIIALATGAGSAAVGAQSLVAALGSTEGPPGGTRLSWSPPSFLWSG